MSARGEVEEAPLDWAALGLTPAEVGQLRADLSGAAEFLLPLAQVHCNGGKWPMEVAAWLIMVRDSCAAREAENTH